MPGQRCSSCPRRRAHRQHGRPLAPAGPAGARLLPEPLQLADLRPLQAIKNQPFGFILFLATVVIAVVSAVEIAKPRSLWSKLSRLTHGLEIKVVAALFVSMMIAWAYKIAQIRIFLYPSP